MKNAELNSSLVISISIVKGELFVAYNIKNAAGPEKDPAVAFLSNSKISTFYQCSFEGYQDTLLFEMVSNFSGHVIYAV